MTVAVVVPAYNEEGKIGRVVEKIRATGAADKIIVVDDCSTDGTSREASEAGAHVICHQLNQGVGGGIRTGLQYSKEKGFSIAVILSGDDQHEPEELKSVLEPLFTDSADFVQGSRRIAGGRVVNPPLFREVTTRLFSLVFTIMAGKRITDGTNGFRAFKLSILDDPEIDLGQSWLNTYELEPYLLYKAVRSKRWRVIESPVTVYYRGTTRNFSKMRPIRDWWRLARPLFFLRFGLRS